MERRDTLRPRATGIQGFFNTSHQILSQFPNNTHENSHLSAERLVARQLAWIGDQIELRRITAGPAGNVPRSIGRSVAAAGDILDCRYNPFTRRNNTLFRLFWRGLSGLEDGGLVFAGALLQVCYLVLQQVSRDVLL